MSSDWCGEGGSLNPLSSMSPCLVSTLRLPLPSVFVFLASGELVAVIRKPYVNPARSVPFKFKLSLMLVCLMLSATLSFRQSLVSKLAQGITAAAWAMAALVLTAGYLRAQPNPRALRVWLSLEAFWNLALFALSWYRNTEEFHSLWAAYVSFSIFLAWLSWQKPLDQPTYVSIDVDSALVGTSNTDDFAFDGPPPLQSRASYIRDIVSWEDALGAGVATSKDKRSDAERGRPLRKIHETRDSNKEDASEGDSDDGEVEL